MCVEFGMKMIGGALCLCCLVTGLFCSRFASWLGQGQDSKIQLRLQREGCHDEGHHNDVEGQWAAGQTVPWLVQNILPIKATCTPHMHAQAHDISCVHDRHANVQI